MMRPVRLKTDDTRRFIYFSVAGISVIYFLCFYTIPPIHHYNSFNLLNFDYGILYQSTYLISQFEELFLTTRGVHAWADNQDYFQAFLSILQLLPNSHYWLLMIHSVAIFSCGLFCLIFLSKYGKSTALAVALAVWLNPFFINMNLDLFHTEAFAGIFLLLLYFSCAAGNPHLFYLFLLSAISCKEDVALTAGFFMLLAMLSPERFKLKRYHYVIGLLICIALVIVNLAVVLPYFKIQTCIRLDPNAVVENVDASPASKNFKNIFLNLRRISFIKHSFLDIQVGRYVFMLMWPVILFVRNKPLLFLLPFPGILLNILSYSDHFIEGYYHYDHCTMAAVIIAVMDGLRDSRNRKIASALFLLLSILISGFFADVRIPLHAGLQKGFYRFEKSAAVKFLEKLNRALPESAHISADYQTMNYLIKGHPNIYMFENPFQTSNVGFGLYDLCDKFKNRPHIDIVIIKKDYVIDKQLTNLLETEFYALSEKTDPLLFWVHPSFLNSPRAQHFKSLVAEFKDTRKRLCPLENILNNGSFENSTDRQPRFWQLETWKQPLECPDCRFQTQAVSDKDGAAVLYSKHSEFNVSRWAQEVPVKPQTPYRLSGWIKTDGVHSGKTGAYLQVDAVVDKPQILWTSHQQLEFLGRTPELFNSSDWRYVEIVFRTRHDHERLKVICGLGDFGAHVKGTVYFDMIQLVDLSDQFRCDLFSRSFEMK